MIKKIIIASVLTAISISAQAGKIVINESTTENVSSVQIGEGLFVRVKEDSKKSYYIDTKTVTDLGLSKKELSDILLSKNSSVSLEFDKTHDHPIQPYVQTVHQILQTAN